MGTGLNLFRPKGGPAGSRPSVLVTLLVLFLTACAPEATEETPPVVKETVPTTPTPAFDPDSAYAYVARQVAFGPRVPGTPAHAACGDWLVAKLKDNGAEVIEQRGTVKAFNGQDLPVRNIIASWGPATGERLLLFAHWDTRPFADHDTERRNEPIDGANDGGSGVGVWLEVARHLAATPPPLAVDIIFFDVEDFGQPNGAMSANANSASSWCLGSQYWVKNLHRPGYTARFGILLDMVGARDAVFHPEAISMNFAPHVVSKVWRTGQALGHGDRFREGVKYFVGTDDHDVVNRNLRIPCIDIIEYDPTTEGFNSSWHTHADNLEVIDPNTLNAVGRTVMEVIWKEK